MKKKILTLGQIMILVLGVVAISYAVGSEIGVVQGVLTFDTNIRGKSATYRFSKTDSANTDFYEKISGEGPQSIGIGSQGETYFLGEDNVYRKSFEEFDTRIYESNPIQEPIGVSTTVTPTSNPNIGQQTFQDDIPSQPAAGFETPGEYPDTPLQEGGAAGAGTQAANTGDSELSWYESILGPSGDNTYTLPGAQYKGKNYYKDGENWMYTKDGADAKVTNEAELDALNSGKGTKVGGASVVEAGQYFLFGMAVASGVKAIVIAAAGGEKDEKAVAVGEGLEKGIQAGVTVNTLMKLYNKNYAGNAGTYVGIAVAVWYILSHYKDVEERSVTFECSVWEAPKGGNNCERCNNGVFGCSEYQCRSLGKGCELLNPGSEEELCTWVNRNDGEAPQISPWRGALNEEFRYTPDAAVSPPDRGVIIESQEGTGCIEAYTPLEFGISLDEPATCKIDIERKNSYEEMDYFFGSSSILKYNHSHTMSLPSINSTGTVIEEGGNMSLFVRCEDANGNSNTGEFIFKFCVDEGEDFTPPLVVDTSVSNNQPVAFNISGINMTAYLNEQAECKWDFTDISFDSMENELDCRATPEIINAQTVYPCVADLSGIEDRAENNYYFRCNDTSGNVNKESYELTLIGTQPLFIDWALPNETVKGASSPVKVNFEVKTSSGAEDGKAYCSYRPIDSLSYVQFLYEPVEMTHEHIQELNLADGNYAYFIRCVDAGGNAVVEEMNFDVETDIGSPVVVRAYKDDGYLKLITDEAGECVYNNIENIGCKYEFDDGILMDTVEEDEHFVEWNTQETFYIKCKDEFGNPPLYNTCSIIARPSEGQTL